MPRSKTWHGITFRPLTAPGDRVRELFSFAGASPPPAGAVGWGAWAEERLVGALILERAGKAAMLHGPVVVAPPDTDPGEVLEVAVQLVADALTHAPGAGIETLYARPHGLDRVWVRAGFVPLPEAELPEALKGRPGVGLFGWRGGTALWSATARAGGSPRER